MLKAFISLVLTIIPICMMKSYADAAPPATPTIDASPIQANGSVVIPILESSIQSYLKKQETQALDYGLHLTIGGQPLVQTAPIEFLANYNRTYCNPLSEKETNLPESCNTDVNNVYGNLRATIIFESLKYSTDTLATAQAAVSTLIDPFPDDNLNTLLSSKASASDPKNQEKIAHLIAKQAPLMMAKNSLNGIIARRTLPNATQKPALPASFAKTVMEIIKEECSRRLTNSSWFGSLSTLPTNQLLTELLQIEAFKLWMEYNKFQQNERIEALLATLIAAQSSGGIGGVGGIPKESMNKLIDGMDKANAKVQETQNSLPDPSTIIPPTPTQ